MHIAVIGTGYVGLVTGACFADFGMRVTCVDKDQDKINSINAGRMPIYEPGLDALVAKGVREGRLEFSTDVRGTVAQSLVVFLAVGTPPSGDGSADMSQIDEVAYEIAKALNGYKVIVTKSTVPVGAASRIKKIIEENKAMPSRFSVAANPEFLREGAAINDFMRPDRVVIGCTDDEAVAILKDIYRPLYLLETPFVITTPESAEMIKYASNAFLATKVSFINEISGLCELLGADVHDVAKGMGMDVRIGSKFLHPGPGFGGSCFPKDAQALVALGRSVNYDVRIVEAALRVNECQKDSIIDRIRRRDRRHKRSAVDQDNRRPPRGGSQNSSLRSGCHGVRASFFDRCRILRGRIRGRSRRRWTCRRYRVEPVSPPRYGSPQATDARAKHY